MEDFELKVGDLVKLRADLEDGKTYDGIYFYDFMRFNDFKKVEELNEFYNSLVVRTGCLDKTIGLSKEMIAEVKRPIEYETIYKREEPILDDKEKEYLGNLIRPFRDRVTYIAKRKENKTKLFIHIQLKDDWGCLPDFKENTMYKNMKIDKSYTLEELGL